MGETIEQGERLEGLVQGFDIEMRFDEPGCDDAVIVFASGPEGERGVVFAADGPADEHGDDGACAFAAVRFPSYAEIGQDLNWAYAFAVDGRRFFVALEDLGAGGSGAIPEGLHVEPLRATGPQLPHRERFAVMCGLHLNTWYNANKLCGACGGVLERSATERALVCPQCGHVVYPRISPAIIVAVTDGDKLLLTRYAQGAYRKRALVAGFMEIGESAEEAVAREVFEETGVRVKNLRYFGSQPWGLSGTLMLGFFAQLDGDGAITVQESELSEAMWVPRDQIEPDDDYALGRQMIDAFVSGRMPTE